MNTRVKRAEIRTVIRRSKISGISPTDHINTSPGCDYPYPHSRRCGISFRRHSEVYFFGRGRGWTFCKDTDPECGYCRAPDRRDRNCLRHFNIGRTIHPPGCITSDRHHAHRDLHHQDPDPARAEFMGFSLRKVSYYGIWGFLHESRTDLAVLFGSLFLFIVGAGRISIDRWINRSKRSSSK